MRIILTLKSDLCAASGLGYATSIDTDIVYDTNTGLPYVPAKRLKGCLREAGLEILAARNNETDATTFYELFGVQGASDGGKLNISEGKLDYTVGKEKLISRSDVLNTLTTIRYGTRMEAANNDASALIKKAKDQSLRAARVINKGEALTFDIAPLEDTHFNFLQECCAILRHMGSNRTRGWGEVECILEGTPITDTCGQKNTHIYESPEDTKIASISYKIILNEPVISSLLSGGVGCEGHIPGSMLMGFFAKQWIKTYLNAENAAHQDPDFMRIFLKSEVKFGFAYPSFDEQPFYPTPASVKTDKKKEAFFDDANSGYKTSDTASARLGGYAKIEDCGGVKKVTALNIHFESVLHHARPHDRAIGSPQENNTAASGAFYSYIALAPRQQFFGSIVGKKNDLDKLVKLLPKEATITLGRSRTAQYGNASVEWITPITQANPAPTTIESNKIRVTARTPIILCDSYGTINPSAAVLAQKLSDILGIKLSVDRTFMSDTIVAGYNAAWRLPRQQMPAIAAGSVIVLNCCEAGAGQEVEPPHFIGLRTGEGFGQIFIDALPEMGVLCKTKTVDANVPSETEFSKNLLKKITDLKVQRMWEQESIGLAKKLIDQNGLPSNAQLGRLLNAIHGKYGAVSSKQELDEVLNKEWKDKKKLNCVQELCAKVYALKPEESEFYKDAEKDYFYCLKTVIRQLRLERRSSDE